MYYDSFSSRLQNSCIYGCSAGSLDIPGGLGAVITPIHEDGKEYAYAFASSTLGPAQKNYYIARLEALAFV